MDFGVFEISLGLRAFRFRGLGSRVLPKGGGR